MPAESQLFVFSKTSLQRDLITPETPRVLYFSDEVYVGWAPTGSFEVTVFDPQLGATFYVLDAHETGPTPLLVRDNDCLLCHARHEHTPTLRTRSVFPDARGEPLGGSGGANIAPSTPLEERWGGWYVTGGGPGLRHRGNLTGRRAEDFEGESAQPTRNLDSLEGIVDTRRYLLKTSDVVPMLLHDHQVHVHNVMSTALQDARIALHRWPAMRAILGLPASAPPQGSCLVVFESQAEKILDALLCRDEAALAGRCGAFRRRLRRSLRQDPQGRRPRPLPPRPRPAHAPLPLPLQPAHLLRKLRAPAAATPGDHPAASFVRPARLPARPRPSATSRKRNASRSTRSSRPRCPTCPPAGASKADTKRAGPRRGPARFRRLRAAYLTSAASGSRMASAQIW